MVCPKTHTVGHCMGDFDIYQTDVKVTFFYNNRSIVAKVCEVLIILFPS